VAKPNYSFEKKQRELAQKKKQDEKRQKKLEKGRRDQPAGSTPDKTSS
jgi:hypothetical protein